MCIQYVHRLRQDRDTCSASDRWSRCATPVVILHAAYPSLYIGFRPAGGAPECDAPTGSQRRSVALKGREHAALGGRQTGPHPRGRLGWKALGVLTFWRRKRPLAPLSHCKRDFPLLVRHCLDFLARSLFWREYFSRDLQGGKRAERERERESESEGERESWSHEDLEGEEGRGGRESSVVLLRPAGS